MLAFEFYRVERRVGSLLSVREYSHKKHKKHKSEDNSVCAFVLQEANNYHLAKNESGGANADDRSVALQAAQSECYGQIAFEARIVG